MHIPLIKPNPPRLSEATAMLRGIEASGIYSNFGVVNTHFEEDMVRRMFGGEGACLTVCNATIGLMIAIRHAVGDRLQGDGTNRRRYALMPSFTFAAAAHAAMWCGLTPLFCDIDAETWAACPQSEIAMLEQFGDEIAVIVPYATFGYDIDLTRYDDISGRYGVPVVVDAAASLGTISADGRGFGAGYRGAIVFSMHATKSFATGEAGIIYSADNETIDQLRQMCNFGFGRPRVATMPGLNGKLSEVGALLGQLRLSDYDAIMLRRTQLAESYRQQLPELTFQARRPGRQAHQFAAALLPRELAKARTAILDGLAVDGVVAATYFSPHLLQQDYFSQHAVSGPMPVTEDVASRVVSLPLFDAMTDDEVLAVVGAMRRQLQNRESGQSRGEMKLMSQPTSSIAPGFMRDNPHVIETSVSL